MMAEAFSFAGLAVLNFAYSKRTPVFCVWGYLHSSHGPPFDLPTKRDGLAGGAKDSKKHGKTFPLLKYLYSMTMAKISKILKGAISWL